MKKKLSILTLSILSLCSSVHAWDTSNSFPTTATSAELAAVLSDESGSGGGFVRAEGSTLTNPIITNIAPGANFTLTQNSVASFTSVETGAVVNTLYLKEGKVGIGTNNPVLQLDLGLSTSGRGISWGGSTGTTNYANIFTSYSSGGLVIARGFRGDLSTDTFVSSYGEGATARAGIRLHGGSTDIGDIIFYTDSPATIPEGNTYTPTERMRIDASGNIGVGIATFGTNAAGVWAQANGTAPTSSITDGYQQYSADQAAGNACAHFRTENGAIIKLYQQAFIASPAADLAALKTAVDAIRNGLINIGLMASS